MNAEPFTSLQFLLPFDLVCDCGVQPFIMETLFLAFHRGDELGKGVKSRRARRLSLTVATARERIAACTIGTVT